MRVGQTSSVEEATGMTAVILHTAGITRKVFVSLRNIRAAQRARSRIRFSRVKRISSSLSASPGTIKLIAQVITSDSNDYVFHVFQVVASILGMEQTVWIDLHVIVQGLSIVENHDISRG